MQSKENSQSTDDTSTKLFWERPYEEEEGGYIDDRGFYTSLNGSFWDDDHTYFNHLGFDKHGGSYDKFGVYLPGPNYNPETKMYKDEEMDLEKKIDEKKIENNKINELRMREKKDIKVVKNFAELIESENESDDYDEDKSDISFDINDMEEALEYALDSEKNKSFENKIYSQNA